MKVLERPGKMCKVKIALLKKSYDLEKGAKKKGYPGESAHICIYLFSVVKKKKGIKRAGHLAKVIRRRKEIKICAQKL